MVAVRDVNPAIVVLVIWGLAIVITVMTFYTNTFFSALNVLAPAPGTAANAISGNFINYGVTMSQFALGTASEFVIVATIFAGVIDVFISWHDPNIGTGILNILLLFVLPLIWLVLKLSMSSLVVLTASGTPIAYAFFLSYYFIFMNEIFLALSAAFNFRKTQSQGTYAPVDLRSSEGIR